MLLNRKAQFCNDIHFSILTHAIDAIPINVVSFWNLTILKFMMGGMAKNKRENVFKDGGTCTIKLYSEGSMFKLE